MKAQVEIPEQKLRLNSKEGSKEFTEVTSLLIRAGVKFTFQPVE